MNNKIIYVDFKNGTKKVDYELQNPSLIKTFYNRLKNMFHFSSGSKIENRVYNFKRTM